MSGKMAFVILFSGIWGFVGLIFFCIGQGIRIYHARMEDRCSTPVKARVTEVRRYKGCGYPVFEYSVKGTLYTRRSTFGSSGCKLSAGDTVDLYYDPMEPEKFYMADRSDARLFCGIFTGVGIACIAVGLIVAAIVLDPNVSAWLKRLVNKR